MDNLSWLWQLNREFSVAPLDRAGSANLVAPPCLDQIDKALLEFGVLSFDLATLMIQLTPAFQASIGVRCRHVPRQANNSFPKAAESPEPPKRVMARHIRIR
jgi:hypothetical protein